MFFKKKKSSAPPSELSLYCSNCHYPLANQSKFCHQCGQKNTDGRITFLDMIREFSDAVFNVDSRIFRTIFALFVPGRLTNEYFQGRHKRYVHPVRIFLVMTILILATVNSVVDDPDFMGIQEGIAEDSKDLQTEYIYQRLDTFRTKIVNEYKNDKVAMALDSLVFKVTKGANLGKRDSITIAHFDSTDSWSITTGLKIATDDLVKKEVVEIIEQYEIKGFVNRILVSQVLRVRKNGGNFSNYLLGNISWLAFLMMPLLALVLKLLYIRRDYYYVEHLIFSFHSHSFVFILYILMMFYGHYNEGLIIGGGFLLIILYLLKALHKVYGQSKIKTFIKFLIMSFSYLFIFIIAFTLTLTVSFMLY